MSLISWKEQYYGEDAKDAAERGTLEALRHSIKKWSGLTPEALAEHGVRIRGHALFDPTVVAKDYPPVPDLDSNDTFVVDTTTCALCVLHLRNCCKTCPLFKLRGVQCDDVCGGETSPYGQFIIYGNTSPMLNLLWEALLVTEESEEPRC